MWAITLLYFASMLLFMTGCGFPWRISSDRKENPHLKKNYNCILIACSVDRAFLPIFYVWYDLSYNFLNRILTFLTIPWAKGCSFSEAFCYRNYTDWSSGIILGTAQLSLNNEFYFFIWMPKLTSHSANSLVVTHAFLLKSEYRGNGLQSAKNMKRPLQKLLLHRLLPWNIWEQTKSLSSSSFLSYRSLMSSFVGR